MKEKIKQIYKKYDLDILTIIIFIISGIALNISFSFGDELWNFYNVFRISEGYVIYKDLNVIVTPLFFYIGKLFFVIFGRNFLIFRIYNIIIFTAIIFLIFKIFKVLKINKSRSILYMLTIIIILIQTILGGANYNTLVLIPVLYGILLMIKEKNNYIKQGIIIFLIFMSKQNFAIYYTLGLATFYFIKDKNIKKTLKELLKTICISIITIIIYLIYLYQTDNLYDFINYCFLGITEFTNNISFNIFDSIKVYLSLIMIGFMICICCIKKTIVEEKIKRNVLLFICIGGFILLTAYPIANVYHSTLASIIIISGFIYTLEIILIRELNLKDKIIKKIYICIIIFLSMFSLINLMRYIINCNTINYRIYPMLNYGNVYSEEDAKNIKTMYEYIKEKEKQNIKVVVLSYEADAYFLNTDINNKNFNLPFLGNLGIEGEEGLIKEISNLENCNILIKKQEEDLFWQESKKVREYIKNNLDKVGNIEQFDIYYTK